MSEYSKYTGSELAPNTDHFQEVRREAADLNRVRTCLLDSTLVAAKLLKFEPTPHVESILITACFLYIMPLARAEQ